MFHGPAFHLLKSGRIDGDGASARLDAAAGSVPTGLLHPALLDAALHAIPHDHLCVWSDKIADDRVAYPARVCDLELFGPMPTSGEVRVEIRFDGFVAAPDLPRFKIQWIVGATVRARMTLVEACFAKGRLGSAPPQQRRSFLRDAQYVEGLSLSRRQPCQTGGGIETRLCQAEIEASDWMPGTVDGVYGSRDLETIAVNEHLAARHRLHPSVIPDALPLSRPNVLVSRQGDDVVVRDSVYGPDTSDVSDASEFQPRLDLSAVSEFWDSLSGVSGPWPGKDLVEGLIQRYVERVIIEDPKGFASVRGRGAIFVANHQVQIESILITPILAGLTQTKVVTMANAKHQRRWIGWMIKLLASYPGCNTPETVVYFNPKEPEAMFGIVEHLREHLAGDRSSFFVHCQGTRARSCRESTDTISSLFLDLAIEQNLAIVPVRFRGGLPVEPLEGKLEFPVGHGRQDYIVGSPIEASELESLAYAERRVRVLDAINCLGGSIDAEQPQSPDPDFVEAVTSWSDATGVGEVESTFYRVLERLADCADSSDLTRQLVAGAKRGRLAIASNAEGEWLSGVARRLFGPDGPELQRSS